MCAHSAPSATSESDSCVRIFPFSSIEIFPHFHIRAIFPCRPISRFLRHRSFPIVMVVFVRNYRYRIKDRAKNRRSQLAAREHTHTSNRDRYSYGTGAANDWWLWLCEDFCFFLRNIPECFSHVILRASERQTKDQLAEKKLSRFLLLLFCSQTDWLLLHFCWFLCFAIVCFWARSNLPGERAFSHQRRESKSFVHTALAHVWERESARGEASWKLRLAPPTIV